MQICEPVGAGASVAAVSVEMASAGEAQAVHLFARRHHVIYRVLGGYCPYLPEPWKLCAERRIVTQNVTFLRCAAM